MFSDKYLGGGGGFTIQIWYKAFTSQPNILSIPYSYLILFVGHFLCFLYTRHSMNLRSQPRICLSKYYCVLFQIPPIQVSTNMSIIVKPKICVPEIKWFHNKQHNLCKYKLSFSLQWASSEHEGLRLTTKSSMMQGSTILECRNCNKRLQQHWPLLSQLLFINIIIVF